MTRDELDALTAALFRAFEDGDFDAAEAMLAPGATIIQNGNAMSWAEARPMLEGLRPVMGAPRYGDVRRTIAGATVVEEHTVSSTTPRGAEIVLHAAVAIRFDDDGLVTSIDEYVDPTPLMDALRTT